MRLFFDTNILLDIALVRQPFYGDSQASVLRGESLGADMFVAWHSMATLFYFVRKQCKPDIATQMIKDVYLWASVARVSHLDAVSALAIGITDYEDALQAAAAEAENCDIVITRNTNDFSSSPVPAVTPSEFLARFGQP
jgi:predicted nucleic acid-binding protein